MIDTTFDVSVDDLDTVLFREEDYTRDILEFDKMFDLEMEPWTNGLVPGSEHRRKYKMPRVGVVPPGPSLHLITRVQTCPGQGYVLDQVVSTPDVTTFTVEFLYVLTAEQSGKSRLIISQKVVIHKSTMAQSFIRSGSKREIANYYKNVWPQFTRKWLTEKRPGMLVTGVANGQDVKLSRQEEETSVGGATQVQETTSGHVWVLSVVCLLLFVHSVWVELRLATLEHKGL